METQVDRRWQYEKIATLKKLSGISTFQLDGKNRAHVIYTAGPDFYYAMQTNKGWKVEKVVNPDLKIVRYNNMDIAIGESGKVHVVYDGVISEGERALVYAIRSRGRWNFSTIARGGYAGAIALDRKSSPIIAYRAEGGLLVLAVIDGNSWKREELMTDLGAGQKEVVRPVAITMTSGYKPFIMVVDHKNGRVMSIRKTRGAWQKSTVKKVDGLMAANLSISRNHENKPVASFEMYESGGIGYAKWDGSRWGFSETGPSGALTPQICSDKNRKQGLVYFTYGYNQLTYSLLRNGNWVKNQVEKRRGGKFFEDRPKTLTLRYDSRNRPVIVYSDPSAGIVGYYRKTRR